MHFKPRLGRHLPTTRFIGVLLLAYSQLGVALDWPNYRGPNRDGSSAETGWTADWPKEGPKQLWKASAGTGFSSISVVGNRAYTMGYSGGKDTVFCIDADNGTVVWEFSYPSSLWDVKHEGGPSSTPTVADGRVYTLSREALFYCLDATTGEMIWSKDLKKEVLADVPRWGFSGSVLVEGDLAIIDVGPTVAFKKDSGELVWTTKEYGSAYSTPSSFGLGDSDLLAAFNKTGLAVLRRLSMGDPVGCECRDPHHPRESDLPFVELR
jgi:outer membrane protein assembly factor BamB